MEWEARILSYERETGFPRALFIAEDQRVYPAGYLKRIRALFPDKKHVLHLFSGYVDTSILPGITVDVSPDVNPDIVDDAQCLTKVPVEDFDLILSDPPYSVEDAERYSTSMVKRNKVMRVLGERATPGTHVVWLDQVLPIYRKDQWTIEAIIGMVKSTNHRFRVVTVFGKKEAAVCLDQAQ